MGAIPRYPSEPFGSRERREKAAALMLEFADRTGLTSARTPRRYLWTDAFAVCNFVELWRQTKDSQFLDAAMLLVDQVHHVLGKHRADDPRDGWVSGLSNGEGEQHPTAGGLRIGKQLPERERYEAFDPELEWDRDGQYFHYLTKWMHALDQAARLTNRPQLNRWARELGVVAHEAFRRVSLDGQGLAWKVSIDLSRALVPTMGQHDALDGYVTYAELRSSAFAMHQQATGPLLDEELESLGALLEPLTFPTHDPLGVGSLLVDAHRASQQEGAPAALADLIPPMLESALLGLSVLRANEAFDLPASRRLAFRELGLSIGLSACRWMAIRARLDSRSSEVLERLERHCPLGDELLDYWLDPSHRRGTSWSDHRDINEVMLATALIPGGVLLEKA